MEEHPKKKKGKKKKTHSEQMITLTFLMSHSNGALLKAPSKRLVKRLNARTLLKAPSKLLVNRINARTSLK